MTVKLISLIKTCLNETYIKSVYMNICLGHLLFRIVWNKETFYRHRSKKIKRDWIEWNRSACCQSWWL